MKRFLCTFLFFPVALLTTLAQSSDRQVIDLAPQGHFLSNQTGLMPIALKDIAPFLAYSVEWESNNPDLVLEISFHEPASGTRSEWLPLEPDAHSERKAPRYISQLGFASASTTHYQLRVWESGQSAELISLRLHFYSPGNSLPTDPANNLEERLDCPCPQPEYLDRAGWCPSGNCPTDPTPQFTDVTHLIVHHSAGANTSSDWAAVVRSIWDYHVNSNGWDDIGYNWLIDPNGVLYQGRGNEMQGAHFCGTNGNTMGVCVLGTFTDVMPATQALASLTSLLAWKACEKDIDPEDFEFHAGSGLNLFNISGHRDGCSTACPGNMLYEHLPALRTDVAAYIDACNVSSSEEILLQPAPLVFPNPANEVVTILLPARLAGQGVLHLTNTSGQVIWRSARSYSGGEQISLSVKGWPRGWYALHGSFLKTPVKILLQ